MGDGGVKGKRFYLKESVADSFFLPAIILFSVFSAALVVKFFVDLVNRDFLDTFVK